MGWHLVEQQSPIYRNHGAVHALFSSALEPRIPHALHGVPGPGLRSAEDQAPALAYLHLLRTLPLGQPGSLPAPRCHFQALAASQGRRAEGLHDKCQNLQARCNHLLPVDLSSPIRGISQDDQGDGRHYHAR